MNRKFTLFLYFFIVLMVAKVLEAFVISLINNVSFSLDISLQSVIIMTFISIGAAVFLICKNGRRETPMIRQLNGNLSDFLYSQIVLGIAEGGGF